MRLLEIPESLLALADERGYRLAWIALDLPDGQTKSIWLRWDVSDDALMVDPDWRTPADLQAHLEESSG